MQVVFNQEYILHTPTYPTLPYLHFILFDPTSFWSLDCHKLDFQKYQEVNCELDLLHPIQCCEQNPGSSKNPYYLLNELPGNHIVLPDLRKFRL